VLQSERRLPVPRARSRWPGQGSPPAGTREHEGARDVTPERPRPSQRTPGAVEDHAQRNPLSLCCLRPPSGPPLDSVPMYGA